MQAAARLIVANHRSQRYFSLTVLTTVVNEGTPRRLARVGGRSSMLLDRSALNKLAELWTFAAWKLRKIGSTTLSVHNLQVGRRVTTTRSLVRTMSVRSDAPSSMASAIARQLTHHRKGTIAAITVGHRHGR